MTQKQLEKVSGAIITSFINLHFLEEAKSLGIFKQKTKYNLSKTLDDLIFIEKNFYEEIEKIDQHNISDKIVANKIEFINWLLKKYSYNDFTKLQEICVAFDIDKERICGISDKIIINDRTTNTKKKNNTARE